MASTFSPGLAPSFMIEPLPNCFSICRIAWSIALVFSVTAISISSSHLSFRNAQRRRLECPLGLLPVLRLALGRHELDRHRLDRRGDGLLLQLSFELLFGFLLRVLVLGLASTSRHSRPSRPDGSIPNRDEHSVCRSYALARASPQRRVVAGIYPLGAGHDPHRRRRRDVAVREGPRPQDRSARRRSRRPRRGAERDRGGPRDGPEVGTGTSAAGAAAGP